MNEPATPVKPNKVQSRAEKRWVERTNAEAQATLNSLMTHFLAAFMDSPDPQGEQLTKKRKELSAKWRVYCRLRSLSLESHPMLDKYMDGVSNQYLKEQEVMEKAELVDSTKQE